MMQRANEQEYGRIVSDLIFWQSDPENYDADYDAYVRAFGSRAPDLWHILCESYDWHNAPEEFPAGKPFEVITY